MLKAYVDSQKFNSTAEIMDAMKEMLRDVLQQIMESELDAELGYGKVSVRWKRLSKVSPGIVAMGTRKRQSRPSLEQWK